MSPPNASSAEPLSSDFNTTATKPVSSETSSATTKLSTKPLNDSSSAGLEHMHRSKSVLDLAALGREMMKVPAPTPTETPTSSGEGLRQETPRYESLTKLDRGVFLEPSRKSTYFDLDSPIWDALHEDWRAGFAKLFNGRFMPPPIYVLRYILAVQHTLKQLPKEDRPEDLTPLNIFIANLYLQLQAPKSALVSLNVIDSEIIDYDEQLVASIERFEDAYSAYRDQAEIFHKDSIESGLAVAPLPRLMSLSEYSDYKDMSRDYIADLIEKQKKDFYDIIMMMPPSIIKFATAELLSCDASDLDRAFKAVGADKDRREAANLAVLLHGIVQFNNSSEPIVHRINGVVQAYLNVRMFADKIRRWEKGGPDVTGADFEDVLLSCHSMLTGTTVVRHVEHGCEYLEPGMTRDDVRWTENGVMYAAPRDISRVLRETSEGAVDIIKSMCTQGELHSVPIAAKIRHELTGIISPHKSHDDALAGMMGALCGYVRTGEVFGAIGSVRDAASTAAAVLQADGWPAGVTDVRVSERGDRKIGPLVRQLVQDSERVVSEVYSQCHKVFRERALDFLANDPLYVVNTPTSSNAADRPNVSPVPIKPILKTSVAADVSTSKQKSRLRFDLEDSTEVSDEEEHGDVEFEPIIMTPPTSCFINMSQKRCLQMDVLRQSAQNYIEKADFERHIKEQNLTTCQPSAGAIAITSRRVKLVKQPSESSLARPVDQTQDQESGGLMNATLRFTSKILQSAASVLSSNDTQGNTHNASGGPNQLSNQSQRTRPKSKRPVLHGR